MAKVPTKRKMMNQLLFSQVFRIIKLKVNQSRIMNQSMTFLVAISIHLEIRTRQVQTQRGLFLTRTTFLHLQALARVHLTNLIKGYQIIQLVQKLHILADIMLKNHKRVSTVDLMIFSMQLHRLVQMEITPQVIWQVLSWLLL